MQHIITAQTMQCDKNTREREEARRGNTGGKGQDEHLELGCVLEELFDELLPDVVCTVMSSVKQEDQSEQDTGTHRGTP